MAKKANGANGANGEGGDGTDGAVAAAPASFEEAMAELAQLVTQMESGQLPLEASVAAYARGSELVKYCAGQLDKVEAQVKVLEGDMLKPFADGDEGAL